MYHSDPGVSVWAFWAKKTNSNSGSAQNRAATCSEVGQKHHAICCLFFLDTLSATVWAVLPVSGTHKISKEAEDGHLGYTNRCGKAMLSPGKDPSWWWVPPFMFVYRLFLVFFQHDFKKICSCSKRPAICHGESHSLSTSFPRFFSHRRLDPARSHWSHPWDSANPLHLGWPGCGCRICRIFSQAATVENMKTWTGCAKNVTGRCRMYQTTWTSNECAGTGMSLQSSVCRELRLLDFGKPSLGVVSTPDKQRPLFHLG